MAIVNLDEFFQHIVESIEEKFSALNISIEREIEFAGPILFDHQRMYRVFMNLADNARKAMPSGGTFTIAVAKNEKTVSFDVSDTGVGMSSEVQRKMFEPFFSHSDRGGTGLWMSIVKSVVEAHHGTLSV